MRRRRRGVTGPAGDIRCRWICTRPGAMPLLVYVAAAAGAAAAVVV